MKTIVDAVATQMKKEGFKRLKRLSLKMNELDCNDKETLQLAFKAATTGTNMEGAALDVTMERLCARCPRCERVFILKGLHNHCPECGNAAIEPVNGNEAEIISMEGA